MLIFRCPVDKVQPVRLNGYPFDCKSTAYHIIYHPRNLSFVISNVNGLSYIKSRSKKKPCCFRKTAVTLLFVSKANMHVSNKACSLRESYQ